MTASILASILTAAIMHGVNINDRDFSRYDYSLPITNDAALPLEAIHLDIAYAQPVASSLLTNWRFDTISGIDYWSALVSHDLQPAQSTTLQFSSNWLTSFTYSAYFFDPVTYDEYYEEGTVTVAATGAIEVPEPASLAALAAALPLLLRRKVRRS